MSVEQMSLVWKLDLAPNQKIVLLAYADHADEDGDNVYPSLSRIAHKTGYSKDQVRRISRDLVESNLMELVQKGVGRGNPHRYKLTLEKGSKLPSFKAKEKVASKPEKVASGPVKGGIAMPPEPSIENHQHIEPPYSRRDADASAKNWFTEFCNRASDLGLEVTPEDRRRVPGHLKTIYENGASGVEMHRVLTAMLDARLRNYPMSPQEALNKVRGIPIRRHLAPVPSNSIAVVGAKEEDYNLEDYA